MEIKTRNETLRPVNIREWNDTVKAYVRSLDIMDRITFNDQLLAYHDKELKKEERAEAGILICILCLADENGEPLLTLDDMETLKKAAFEPIGRVINLQLRAIENTDPEEEPKNP